MKNNTASLYVLDPETTLFRLMLMSTEHGFKPLYAAMGCTLVEALRFDDRHLLFADEDGLRDGLTAFTIFDGYPQPLAGKLVLACLDDEPFATPLISIEDAANRFECARPLLDPVFSSEEGTRGSGLVFSTVLQGFQTRIERRAPTITEGAA